MDGMVTEEKVIRQLKCKRCGYKWYPATPNKPKYCAGAGCHTEYWDREPVQPHAKKFRKLREAQDATA